ncbi:CDP-diacylglycerol--glycerol-3-phosphate 3-phosphatidyltransferase [Reticulomyxa filosa]|uniref:CDP-diacylglycerol--glycerol-3-phosphate 3-phosphatidyltransferase n=1 Tax=Reticulomyxa filosa TaxID=46433 RepID=X6NJ82_RETFI|nr:CDP-diacylglycerol--glycerol-3-phosphate 3-phosphatidyltransferase [Reticulomyxa filosa]|eukprot:ETO25382.1 CDP-diacylglycerol--glycerol-3-phosphate 3-phosphatidyltransferase [Reticulomyxa filosa]
MKAYIFDNKQNADSACVRNAENALDQCYYVEKKRCDESTLEKDDDKYTLSVHYPQEKTSHEGTVGLKFKLASMPSKYPWQWLQHVSQSLQPWTHPQLQSLNKTDSSEDKDTCVIMSTQLMDRITNDSQLTCSLLSLPHYIFNDNDKVQPLTQTITKKMATAYFNIFDRYQTIMLAKHDEDKQNIMPRGEREGGIPEWHIITASEQCNSFYKSQGWSGYVTPLYEMFAQDFERRFNRRHSHSSSLIFHRYSRPLWTFHGKGLWVDFSSHLQTHRKNEPFALTLIGSSNFGICVCVCVRMCYHIFNLHFFDVNEQGNAR